MYSLLNSALLGSVERCLRRFRNPKILKKSPKLLQKSSLLRRFSHGRLLTNQILETGHRNEFFNEDHSDSEMYDDSDNEEDDYMERVFHEKGQKIRDTFYHSDNSEDSDDSEDEAMVEMDIEMLEEDLKRMGEVFEMHGKAMSENERRDFKRKFDAKKMQLGALEEMLETRHMMEEEEEMQRAQEEMEMLEEDLDRIKLIFETNSEALSENEIRDLEENYLMKKRQLIELQTFGNLREMDGKEEMEDLDNMNGERSALEQPVDLLQKHIGDHELGLVFRPPTRWTQRGEPD